MRRRDAVSRRELAQRVAVAIPAIKGPAGKSYDSKVAGAPIGLNVPYNFGSRTMDGDEILRRFVELGISALELRSQPVPKSFTSRGARPRDSAD